MPETEFFCRHCGVVNVKPPAFVKMTACHSCGQMTPVPDDAPLISLTPSSEHSDGNQALSHRLSFLKSASPAEPPVSAHQPAKSEQPSVSDVPLPPHFMQPEKSYPRYIHFVPLLFGIAFLLVGIGGNFLSGGVVFFYGPIGFGMILILVWIYMLVFIIDSPRASGLVALGTGIVVVLLEASLSFWSASLMDNQSPHSQVGWSQAAWLFALLAGVGVHLFIAGAICLVAREHYENVPWSIHFPVIGAGMLAAATLIWLESLFWVPG